MLPLFVVPFVYPSSIEYPKASYVIHLENYYINQALNCRGCKPMLIMKNGTIKPLTHEQWRELMIQKYRDLQDYKGVY